ncbi:AP complex subunit sigma [Balamuthia mandrillaris]
MIHWLLCLNRQGKIRLNKYYTAHTSKERERLTKEMINLVLRRHPRHCNFVPWKDYTIIYRRYASLYFIVCCDTSDNELIMLEIIHLLVRALDSYFGEVCELDLIYNFDRAYQLLDETLMAGELQEVRVKKITHPLEREDLKESKELLDRVFV